MGHAGGERGHRGHPVGQLELQLHALALADVAHDGLEVGDALELGDADRDLDGEDAAVLAPEAGLEEATAGLELLALAQRQVLQRGRIAEVGDAEPERLLAGVAEQLGEPVVDLDEPVVLVGQHHDVVGVAGHGLGPAQPRGHLGQGAVRRGRAKPPRPPQGDEQPEDGAGGEGEGGGHAPTLAGGGGRDASVARPETGYHDGVTILLYVLGVLALLVGLAGVVLPVLPGALALWGGVWLIAWAGDFQVVGAPTIAVTGVLALLIMAADWAATALGARAFGASRWAVMGATLGLLVGLFLGPVGILLGPVVGAVALELWKDPNLEKALQAGVGTLLGFLAGSVVKVVLAFLLLGVLVVGLLV